VARRTYSALLTLLCLACAWGRAVSSRQAPSAMDAIFSPLEDNQSPGAAVLVRRDGRTVFEVIRDSIMGWTTAGTAK